MVAVRINNAINLKIGDIILSKISLSSDVWYIFIYKGSDPNSRAMRVQTLDGRRESTYHVSGIAGVYFRLSNKVVTEEDWGSNKLCELFTPVQLKKLNLGMDN